MSDIYDDIEKSLIRFKTAASMENTVKAQLDMERDKFLAYVGNVLKSIEKTSFQITIIEPDPDAAEYQPDVKYHWWIGYGGVAMDSVIVECKNGSQDIFDKLSCDDILLHLHDEIERSAAAVETAVEKKSVQRDKLKHFNSSDAMLDAHRLTGNVRGL